MNVASLISPSVLGMRLLIVVLGAVALWAAAPRRTPGGGVVVLVVVVAVALLPAVAPGSWLTLAVHLIAVAAWVVRTVALGEPVEPLSLAILAIALYLHHTLCGLAEHVPRMAVVSGSVFARWLAGSAPVVLVAAGSAVAVAMLPVEQWRDSASVPFILLGIVLVPALVALAFLRHPKRGT